MYLNFLNQINFAIAKKNNTILINKSSLNYSLVKILIKLNIIKKFNDKNKKILIYINLFNIKKIKIYYTRSNFKYIKYLTLKKQLKNSLCYNFILTTNKGLLLLEEAVHLKCGGKLVCIIY
jgi:ribosomal protein S8